ncbi:MAG: alpha/beta hydrolase [Betaproteobacteria bacterium]|nr:alpha/beta hydrolase [Betaproteobacteria bacterium]
MAFWSWGDPLAPHVVVCVHGLTRQGRDFDRLARALVERSNGRVQVICPDVAGRGQSDWLPQSALYQIPQYASDMLALLAALQQRAPIATLDWVGTSMGGMIGMVLAGQPQLPLPAPIRRLVLNDVGPSIAWASLRRMQAYVGRYGRYADLAQAAAALRELAQGFGPVPDGVWLELSAAMVRAHPEGGLTLHYDPLIGEPVRAMTEEAVHAAEAMAWGLYEQIRARVLLIRGLDSDLLTPETAQAMTERGPRAQLLQWAGVGHAPTLTAPYQIEALLGFLLDPPACAT